MQERIDISPSKRALMICSGGQTGVDRGALDAALNQGVPCGGWCPRGRLAEDGPLAEKYPLKSLPSGGYRERTLKNVLDSDGTLIIYFSELEGGTKQTLQDCLQHHKPYHLIDGDRVTVKEAVTGIEAFVLEHELNKLNIAGPRQSRKPQAYLYAYRAIARFLEHWREKA